MFDFVDCDLLYSTGHFNRECNFEFELNDGKEYMWLTLIKAWLNWGWRDLNARHQEVLVELQALCCFRVRHFICDES